MSLRRIAGEFSNKDSASRAQKQTKFAVLPRRRLSGRGFGPQSVQAERKSKRSLRFCRGGACLGGASARSKRRAVVGDTRMAGEIRTLPFRSERRGARVSGCFPLSFPLFRDADAPHGDSFLRIFRFLFALLEKRVTFALG